MGALISKCISCSTDENTSKNIKPQVKLTKHKKQPPCCTHETH